MPNVPLSLDTIAGLRNAFEGALADIAASLADESLGDGKRRLTVQIAFEPKGSHIITSTEVSTRTPARAITGVAWNDHGVLVTEELCRPDDGRQTTHPALREVAGGKSKKE